MTYLLYVAWIGCMMLAAGELDRLLRGFLYRRFRTQFPDTHWLVPVFSSFCIPGLGQFLNGQPSKALFLFTWPLLTLFRSPVPPPWQLVAVKSLWFLLPSWGLAVLDALVVSAVRELRKRKERASTPPSERDRALDSFLRRRNGGADSTPKTDM